MRDLQKTSALYIRPNCSTCNKTQCLLLFWDWDIRTLPIRIVLWDMRLDISNLVDPLITPIVKQGLKREGWSNSYTVRHSDVLVSYFRNWTVGLYTVNVNHDILNVISVLGPLHDSSDWHYSYRYTVGDQTPVCMQDWSCVWVMCVYEVSGWCPLQYSA